MSFTNDMSRTEQGESDNQIVAVYETASEAQSARERLVGEGVPASAIEVLDRETGDATAERREDEGFWGAMKNLFAPEDDYRDYHHALGQGHAMVVVTPTSGMDRRQIVQVLEQTNPIDFDNRVEEWRRTGYGTATPRTTEANQPGATERAQWNTGAAARASETPAPQNTGEWLHRDTPERERPSQANTSSERVGNDDTLKVVQERLRVGKREVEHGGVRVRSYVVERPVEEQVRLHEEHVEVERHPVDRKVEPGEAGLFQERTLEARATAEEAVVNKEARVVEEIGLKKESSDRTETVRDTVRETKVEVEDDAKGATRDPRQAARR